MNILIVTESFPPHAGGSGWSTLQLCKALIEKGNSVIVAKLFGNESEYDGIKIIPIKPVFNNRIGREVLLGSMKKQISKIVKENDINVVHSQHMLSTLVIADLDVKKVATIRDYWPLCYKGSLFNNTTKQNYEPGMLNDFICLFQEEGLKGFVASPYLIWRTWNARKQLKKVDKVVCVSDFVKRMMNFIPLEKLITVFNMIDLEKLDKVIPKRFNKKTIVYVGKLEKPKGAQVLFEAVRGMDLQLKIIGEGKLRKSLESYALNNQIDVEFLDYIPNNEVLSYIKGSDILVVPSLWNEPLGRTILEGIGLGVVVISANRGGTPEIIEDGVDGFLFDGTSKDLQRKIKEVLGDEALLERISQELKKKSNSFSFEKVILNYKKVY